ncbi:conserved hypothetical protein [Microcystis aeruginosa PCC 9443]|uniref:Uncharacterized protein n=1 Tax=Microcystis aeruginosa PCC 9443 TaxID=1160281 RepID=I4FZJ0_MICAE|nr:conserved hypothetical protein [Microcystis aeruginosa PCC 9443]
MEPLKALGLGAVTLFQSLIGFKINWNLLQERDCYQVLQFQSLIGFKINWNAYLLKEFIPLLKVSIPNRV